MTLQEIADYCTLNVGVDDTDTKAQAKELAQLRYKMVWDHHRWTESLMFTSQNVSAGAIEVTLDAGMKVPLSARWDDLEITPVDAQNVLQLDAQAWDQSGEPLSFVNIPRDSSTGAPKIRLVRVPHEDGTLLIMGKKKCPTLADSDEPSIAGIDPCLCALTLADLYRWLRQFSKSRALMQEGTALLTQMVEMERHQQGMNTRIIPQDGFGSSIGYDEAITKGYW